MAELPFNDIGTRLRWHRNLLNMTQSEYAKLIATKRPVYSHWETGQARLSLNGALALREKHGLSLDFLFLGNDDALPLSLRHEWRNRAD